jgi:putative glutamine amidotransferase
VLSAIAGAASVEVNSLHNQGVDRLGAGLAVEAVAPDGLVEAFRVEDAPQFALGVQWHPEWQVADNPLSMSIFRAFGDACRRWVAR